MVVRQVANNTVGAAAVGADPRAGAEEVAADCLAGGSPQVRVRCSYPTAASAGTGVADAAAACSAGATADCDAVAVAVVGNGCAEAVTVAVPNNVVLWKLLLTLPDSTAVAGVGVVRAVEFLEHS